ncbi:MAG TPA: ABC transporter ATP-binding protein, partial [Acidiferrobacteraceae bacterium]|nr:ABC transporter ATP-binding protein [Acidiferrobacteraceae bacterium]
GARERVVLLGESGSGKTTLALAVARLLPERGAQVREGKIRFEGQDVLRLEEREMRAIRGRGITLIFQEPQSALNPVRTIGQQLAECVGGRDRSAVTQVLEAVGLPPAQRILQAYPHQLSGGMRQRAMIAMALLPKPRLIIADEPTSALDVTVQAQILELLGSAQAPAALLFVTHDLQVAHAVADTVVVLYAGQVMEVAPRDAFFQGPGHPYSRALFAAVPGSAEIPVGGSGVAVPTAGCPYAPRCSLRIAACELQDPPWVRVSGSQIRCHRAEEPGVNAGLRGPPRSSRELPGESPLLQVQDLEVRLPLPTPWGRGRDRVVVDQVSFAVGPGQTTALVGESGSGKSTIARSLLRLIPASAGQVTFLGQDWLALQGRSLRACRAQLQMIFQDPQAALDPRMDAGSIVTEGLRAQGVPYDTTDIVRVLAEVGLPPEMARRYPHQLSGGQRARLGIARAVALKPRLLVCDEPTSALDVSVQAQILELLGELQSRLGISYLLITHNMALVDALAHDVLVLYAGRIVERGPARQVLQAPRHPYTETLVRVARDLPAAMRLEPAVHIPFAADAAGACAFRPRCPRAGARCAVAPSEQAYPLGRYVRCHYPLQAPDG